MNGIVSLADADATCGRKAAALGVLLRAGLPVPDGLVAHATAPGWERSLAGALGGGPFAVRSSARFEDGAEVSFAGQLRTVLDVDRGRVVEAVQLVTASIREPGVRAYAAAQGVALSDTMPVLVQEMVSPEAAGVLFADLALGRWTIEAVPGLGDAAVDGRITPERWVIDGQDRPSVQRNGPEVLTEAVVTRLCDLSEHVVEVIDGGPQDIEWAMTPDRLWLLQSRPITRPVHAMGRASGGPTPGR